MAGRCEEVDLEAQSSDTSPLLMDQLPGSGSTTPAEHVVTIQPVTSSVPTSSSHVSFSPAEAQQESPSLGMSRSLSANSFRGLPSFASTTSNSSLRSGNTSSHSARQRPSPLNSGLWVSIELTITISQIIASIIVLVLSRNEHPQAPLHVWVAGYAAGCLATLPLLYWRYTHQYMRTREPASTSASEPNPSSGGVGGSSYVTLTPGSRDDMAHGSRQRSGVGQVSSSSGERTGIYVERFKIALDCFFAIWFVVGNVWIFGGHSAAHDAPNLYRLCIVLLTFSCIGYAMPFILCATICCCLPCIIALLGFREDQNQPRGASQEAIAALPTYKFKAKASNESKLNKDGNDSDSEGAGEGGWVAAGTEKERWVSADDAVCCICLGKYKDGVELRELVCTHHFHVECVDKWLKINASCPLCKYDIGGSAEAGDVTSVEAGGDGRDRAEGLNNAAVSSS